MDYSFDQINQLIKENRKRFSGLQEEEAKTIEQKDKLHLVEHEYRKMQQKGDTQISRLRDKITKIDEKLEKKQPRIVVPKSTDRGQAQVGGPSTRRRVTRIHNLLNGLRSSS